MQYVVSNIFISHQFLYFLIGGTTGSPPIIRTSQALRRGSFTLGGRFESRTGTRKCLHFRIVVTHQHFSQMGIFTELSILYSKYKPAKRETLLNTFRSCRFGLGLLEARQFDFTPLLLSRSLFSFLVLLVF